MLMPSYHIGNVISYSVSKSKAQTQSPLADRDNILLRKEPVMLLQVQYIKYKYQYYPNPPQRGL